MLLNVFSQNPRYSQIDFDVNSETEMKNFPQRQINHFPKGDLRIYLVSVLVNGQNGDDFSYIIERSVCKMCTFRTISNLSPALCLLLLHKCTLHSVPDAHLKPADRPAPGITDFWSLNLRNKCCGHGEFLAFLDDLLHPHCVISTDQLQRKINASEWSRSFQQSGTLYERMWCSRSSEVRLLRQSDAPHYHLLADGSVRHRHTDRSSYRTVCGDLVDVDGQLMQSLTAGDLAALDQNYSTVVLCERGRDETFEKILLNSGLAISLCFLVVTLLLGLCTPELRQRVHHECLLRYVAALIVAFVSIICIQNWDIYNTCCSFGGKYIEGV